MSKWVSATLKAIRKILEILCYENVGLSMKY